VAPQLQFGMENQIGRTSPQFARRVEAMDGRNQKEMPPGVVIKFS